MTNLTRSDCITIDLFAYFVGFSIMRRSLQPLADAC
jgi:hypothetical protein